MLRKTILSILVLMLLTGVGGCVSDELPGHKKLVQDDKKQMVLDHLREKYGEEFEGVSFSPAGLMQKQDIYHVRPKNGDPDVLFDVTGEMLEDGTYKMRDGYFGIMIKEKYDAAMHGFVSEVYDEFVMYTCFAGNVFPDSLNKDTELQDIYAAMQGATFDYFYSYSTVFIRYTGEVNVDEALMKIAQRMVEKKLVGDVTIYEVYDEKYDALAKLPPEKILDQVAYDYPPKDRAKCFYNYPAKEISVDAKLEITY